MSDGFDSVWVRDQLQAFYRENARALPWRETQDPYRIWVSEIMLQQTQVKTVTPRYGAFLEQYPDVYALARATEEQVCESWAGLGYYRRARLMHRAAQQVVHEYDGAFPSDAKSLEKLSGVGRYTAGAIASIAFGETAPIVDGNVERVLSRFMAFPSPVRGKDGARQIWSWAAALADGPDPGTTNQAIMELGASYCSPQSPECLLCPLQSRCAGESAPERFPVGLPKPKVTAMTLSFALLRDERGVWLQQRGLSGLWPGLWEPPSYDGDQADAHFAERFAVPFRKRRGVLSHRLTHRQITGVCYEAAAPLQLTEAKNFKPFDEPLAAPVSAIARKAIVEFEEKNT